MRKIRIVVGFVVGFVLVLVLIYGAYINNLIPKQYISEARGIARGFIQGFYIFQKGESEYIAGVVETELSKPLNANKIDEVIVTSLLPLKKTFVHLDSFPKGAGSLVVVDEELLVMDRLGGIYHFDDNNLKKLRFAVPNRIDEFIINYELSGYKGGGRKVSGYTMNSHSIVYYKKQKRLFVSHTKFIKKNITRFVVSSIGINDDSFQPIGTWRTDFESENIYSNPNAVFGGGGLLIHNDSLFVSVGYTGGGEIEDGKLISPAQDDKSKFGKIFKINLNDGIVQQYSKGHRISQSLAATNNNQILGLEHGPQGGDEINLIQLGKNYGWPIATYGTRYDTYDYFLPEHIAKDNLNITNPIFSFVPSIAPSTILQINNFNDRWNGDLLIGALKAQSIYRLKFNDGRVIFSEPIWVGHRVRDVVILNHKVILLTDDSFLIFLEVDKYLLRINEKSDFKLYNNIEGKDLYNYLRLNELKLSKCLVCHQFGNTVPSSMAPSLANVYNRRIGGDTFEKYSEALKNKKGVWTKENLISYISSPSDFVPGTTMPDTGVSKEEAREIVESLLRQ
jgi:cytochrome c2